jgi:flagellar basal body rod protein FlgG
MIINSTNAINTSLTQVNKTAENISKYGIEKGTKDNIVKDMISLITEEKNVQLNVKAIQTKDQMLGTLLDIKG